jgi:hypothetical protein
MLCYFDPLNNFLTGVPQPLQERVASEREQEANRAFGVRFEGFGPGWVSVAIAGIRDPFTGNPGSLQEVIQFLTSESIVCADIEPRDVLTIYGRKDPISVAIARGLESGNPQLARLFSRVRPDEISSNLDAAINLVFNDQPTNELQAEDARMNAAIDMSSLGVKIDGQDAWLAHLDTASMRDALGPQPEPNQPMPEDFIAESPSEYIDPFDPRYHEDGGY